MEIAKCNSITDNKDCPSKDIYCFLLGRPSDIASVYEVKCLKFKFK